jgi:hypothetical protein
MSSTFFQKTAIIYKNNSQKYCKNKIISSSLSLAFKLSHFFNLNLNNYI